MNPWQILHFEDDVEDRLMFSMGMKREGFCVIPARTPGDVLRLAKDKRPDAIVLDVMYYDDLDAGLRLCEELRRTPDAATAKIVILSNRGDQAARDRGDKVGADAFLEKGSIETCARKLRDLLQP